MVLLEIFHGSARWDVLPVGREVNFRCQNDHLQAGHNCVAAALRVRLVSLETVVGQESFLKSLNINLHGVAIAGRFGVSLHDDETGFVSFLLSKDLYSDKSNEVKNTSIILNREPLQRTPIVVFLLSKVKLFFLKIIRVILVILIAICITSV